MFQEEYFKRSRSSCWNMKREGAFYFGLSAIWRDGDRDCYWREGEESVVAMFTSYHRLYLNSPRTGVPGRGLGAGGLDLGIVNVQVIFKAWEEWRAYLGRL